MYVDELLQRLQTFAMGCYIGNTFLGSFGYADDISIDDICGKQHVQDRVAACRRAFYGMRDAGGLDPYTMAHIWKTALQPVLMYGVHYYS